MSEDMPAYTTLQSCYECCWYRPVTSLHGYCDNREVFPIGKNNCVAYDDGDTCKGWEDISKIS